MDQIKNDDWKILESVYSMLIKNNVLNTPASEPVVRFEYPEDLKKLIDFSITNHGIDDIEKVKNICEQIMYYSVKTAHPQFHNQLFGGVDPFALAGSWITDALNTSQYTYEVGPVFTLMEKEIFQIFLKKFGYTDGDGLFSPGGSISNFYGMVLATYKAIPNVKQTGLFGCKPLVAFTSDESHYSLRKAVHWLGIGTENLISVKTDHSGRMLCDDLRNKIKITLQQNKQPFFVNATSGTTVFGAFDSLNDIADVCQEYKLWMHVDACLGGSVVMSNTYKHLIAGIERSDSLSWNPHKSLGVPLQCSMFLIKQKGLLGACNSASAQYLFQQDKFYDVSYDTGDKSVQCGRKVDVFKFWLMLKSRGLKTIETLINNAMEQSKYLTEQIEKRNNFRLVGNVEFSYTNICFWYIPKRMQNQEETKKWWTELYTIAPAIKEKMIKCGSMMIGYSPLPNRGIGNFLRMVLTCCPPATKSTIDYILDEIERLGEQC